MRAFVVQWFREWQYRMRIAELQVELRLVPAKGLVFFACNNQPANVFIATFFETDPPAASVERGDRTVTAYQVRTASGAKPTPTEVRR